MKQDRLAELRADMQEERLPLQDGSTLVFGRGDPDAAVFIVGEAPGAKEDELGEPFVGRSGQVLSKGLEAVGLSEEADVYIANVVKYRPPENRDPRVGEVREHAPYLYEQISIVDPEVIVPLGNTAAEFFFEEDSAYNGISTERGDVFVTYGNGTSYQVFPSYHPAATLYDRSLRGVFVEDLGRVVDMVADT